MTLAGAVMTSALVSGSAQMVVERSALAADAAGGRRRRPRGAPPVMATVAADLFFQLGGDLFRVGELQVDHLRVAAALERRVEMRDQRLDAQAHATCRRRPARCSSDRRR